MKQIPSFLRIHSLLFIGLVFITFPWVETEARSTTITEITVRPARYVIDADWLHPHRDLNFIKGTVTVRYEGPRAARNTRVRVRLVDPLTGEAFPLWTGTDLAEPTTFDPGTLEEGEIVEQVFAYAMAPYEQLDASIPYRIEARVELAPLTTFGMWASLAWNEGPARHFYHFTNFESDDPDYNVIAGVEDLDFDRDWRIRTIEGKDSFPLSFTLRLARFDGWEEEPTWDTIPFEVQVRLLDNLDNVIMVVPLAPEQASFSETLPSHFEGDPWTESFSYDLDILPPAQLRVSDRTYRVEVEVRSPPRPKAPMATLALASTTLRTFLDYSGDLRFGAGDRAFLMRITAAERTDTPVGIIPGASYANTELVINRVEHPFASYSYAGALGTLTVRLSNTGVASFHDTGADPFQIPNEAGGWQDVFYRGMLFQVGPYLYAGAAGVTTSVKIDQLPAGFGLASEPPIHETFFLNQSRLPERTGVFVNGSLAPVDPVRWDYNAWAFEESKPIAIKISAITLVTGSFINTHLELEATGETFDPLADWYALLDEAPDDLPDRLKHANDGYYRLVTGVDTTQPVIVDSDPNAGPNANARLSVTFTMGSGYVRPHFPHAELVVNTSTGRLRITNDLIDVEASFLPRVSIYVFYNDGAPPDATGCDEDGPSMTHFAMRGIIDNGRLSFTPLGGLWAECARIGPETFDLGWGRLDEETHAFSANGFEVATFYMPGTFYPFGAIGAQSFQGGHHYAPVAASIMGYVPGEWEMHKVEWPSLPAYRENSLRAYYAGVNLPVEGQTGVFGQSFIGGEDAGAYPLKEDSRYYVRKAGVTGIHDAIGGPEAVVLYGFNAVFDSYGFAFRDSVVVDSVTDGGLFVPYPSAFSLPLRNFEFTATGRPLRADLSETLDTVVLSYWNCTIRPVSMTFERDPENICDLGSGFIKLHAEVSLPNIGESLYGDLGFASDGNLSTPAQGGVRSRLTAPNQMTFRGPRRADNGSYERYTFTPATEIYFNNYAYHAEANGNGFINLAGSLSVAFFEDLKIHLQTSVGSGDEADMSLFDITRGWTVDGEDFFSNPRGFDPTNRGFPAGMTLADYLAGEQFRPVARRQWMNGITFEYPLDWDAAALSFQTAQDFDDSIGLLLLDADHRLLHLSAERAEIQFGTTFSGIPSLNPTSILVNHIDEVTGALSALQEALGDAVAGALFLGAAGFSDLLNDSINSLLGDVLDDAFEALVLAQILAPLGDPGNDDRLRPESEWDALLNHSLTNPNAWLLAYLRDLAASTGTPPLLATVQEKLDDVLAAIDVFIDDEDGILATDSEGRYTMGARLIYALVDKLMPSAIKASLGINPGGSAEQQINAQTTRYINQYAPQLATLKDNLTRLRTQIEEVRDGLDAGDSIAAYIHARFTSTEGRDELNALADLLKSDVESHLRSRYAGRAHEFGVDENREASAAFISLRVRDRLATTAIAGSVQIVFRQQLQDLQRILDQTTGSVFSTLNRVIDNVTKEALGAIDDAITPFKGGLGSVAGTANVSGSARIIGNRLDTLSLNASLELKLDEPVKFEGFIEINQAAAAYGEARDIRIGAIEVPIPLLGSTAHYDLTARLVLAESGSPLGIGGSIELKRGEIQFEAFRITTLGAALMFGAQENYIAAKLGMEFQSFQLVGGIFLGRSLYIDPLEMVDPDVAEMITPPFTGFYVYGEVFMPIVDFGCFFRVSAGLGVGAFYFVEGPTYGGKIYAAVQGRAICLVSVKGEVVLIGVKTDIFRFKGRGRISGSVGKCPFCVRFGKSVAFTYDQRSGFSASF